MMVDNDMAIAATAGGIVTPANAKTPPAIGIAARLYPVAQTRFCSIFR